MLLFFSTTFAQLMHEQALTQKYINEIKQKSKQEYVLVVSKTQQKAFLYNMNGNLVKMYMVSTGKKPGQKRKYGDCRTPEGIFKIKSIEDCSNWITIVNGDTLKYGNYFVRLIKGIGIHGTNQQQALGTRASQGCIRMKITSLDSLVEQEVLKQGCYVVILPDP